LVQLAERLKPDLTVVGPEVPVVLGVADEFARRGLLVLAPSRAAARLEGSKIFAKEFLTRHRIPTAAVYGAYDSPGDAYSALCAVDWPVVIKADGLCGGKGVLVAESPDDATAFIERLMEKREFGDSGSRILLEEALVGEELSYIVLTDGEQVFPLAPTRDHKRAFDGNMGPNTGGMGAYSADGLIDGVTEQLILERIVGPTVCAMAKEATPYRGFLYFGLMLTADGPKVLEFNCRMGDPEAQPLVVRMNFDLAGLLHQVAGSALVMPRQAWRPGGSVCVVLTSSGYPGHYETGKEIQGLAEASAIKNVTIFHGGTRRFESSYYSSSGRVLGVTATGDGLEQAVRTCYEAAGKIHFEGMHYRRDIGDPGVGAGRRAAG
jgi:phosphoribosylamine--glycine ligase